MTIENWLNSVALSEVSIVSTYIAKQEIYPLINKGRNHHGFIYTVSGVETYHSQEKSIVAVPNSILYMPKGSKYKVTLDGDVSVVIYIDFELSEEISSSPFLIKFEDDKTIMPLFSDAEKISNKKNNDQQSALKSVFYKICSRMIRRNDGYMTSNAYYKISESINYLHCHYMEKEFRISKLYEISGVSSRYYERLFFQRFGLTPKEYVIKLKIDYAKELLFNEKSSIQDIAIQLGYNDIYHFGKIFKQKTGSTPGQYRKLH